MAGFQTETFIQQDPYSTPKYACENIQRHLIPKDNLIREAFYRDGLGFSKGATRDSKGA